MEHHHKKHHRSKRSYTKDIDILDRGIWKVLMYLSAFVAATWFVISSIPTDAELVKSAHETLAYINQNRQSAGLNTLEWDNELEAMAMTHSQWMLDNEDFNHSDYGLVENIARGQFGSESLFNLWKNSIFHHNNLLEDSIQYAAIGVAFDRTELCIWGHRIPVYWGDKYATFLAR